MHITIPRADDRFRLNGVCPGNRRVVLAEGLTYSRAVELRTRLITARAADDVLIEPEIDAKTPFPVLQKV